MTLELRVQIMIDHDEAVEVLSIINDLLQTNFLTDPQRKVFGKIEKQIENVL